MDVDVSGLEKIFNISIKLCNKYYFCKNLLEVFNYDNNKIDGWTWKSVISICFRKTSVPY
jgi:hypothetical protein